MDLPERPAPPAFSSGWFAVCSSDELGPKGVRTASLVERELVVFRARGGTACVIDAYCPHLGAHLGVGGTVEGDTIRCPFHGWRWRGSDGQCVEVPYATCVPAAAKIGCWTTIERNGLVMAWLDADEQPAAPAPETIPELTDGRHSFFARRRVEITAPGSEACAARLDSDSLRRLHGAETRVLVRNDRAVVRPLHPANLGDRSATRGARNEATVRLTHFGPGLSFARISGAIDAVVVQSVTPRRSGVLELTHDSYLHDRSDRFLAEGFFDELTAALPLAPAPPAARPTPSRPAPSPVPAVAAGVRLRRRRQRTRVRPADASV